MALKKSQKSLKNWTDQEWTTKSGKPSTQGSKATGERYLPKKAIAAMSDSEYAASSRKKREDTKKGKQFSKQPKKAAKTARRFRNTGGIMSLMEATRNIKPLVKMAEGGSMLAPKDKKFPDLTGDGKVTRADVLKGRGVFQEGGEVPVDTYPNIPPEEMAEARASQLPDNEMEDQYINYIINETLDESEQQYLQNALASDPQLNSILDKVMVTAAEFSGAGEVDGPGTGVSDSIPARLSDGEFVMTKKATDQIGADNLQRVMDEAERAYDGGLMSRPDSLAKTSMSNQDIIQRQMAGSSKMPSIR